ncbi:hypothetical protein MNJPNG_02640 [Cupriavidus oxalaticus]
MPVWISEPGDTAGDAILRDWRVLQTYAGSRHFVGRCIRTGPYRVSPPIMSFNSDTRTGVCKRGLHFVLSGPPSRESGLWQLFWLVATWSNKVSGSKDITGEYLER